MARGQYDSYELFVELGRRLLHDRGVFGFIVPDSITLPEHEAAAPHVVGQRDAHAAGPRRRGALSRVFRAAFFLCFVNRPAGPDHQVRVATLRKDHRKVLEADTLFEPVKSVAEVVGEIGHVRPQVEFAENPRVDFDILGRDVDRPIVARIDAPTVEWASLTVKGRGVEIGKSGDVLQCPYCYRWDNIPRKSKGVWPPKKCRHCERKFRVGKSREARVHYRRAAAGKELEAHYLRRLREPLPPRTGAIH